MPPQIVPQYLGCADLGLALRQPNFSAHSVAPIKLGEYLMCGLPVVATAGIGDPGAISVDVGAILVSMDDAELKTAADWFVDSVQQCECYRFSSRAVGLNGFSVKDSVVSCDNMFNS